MSPNAQMLLNLPTPITYDADAFYVAPSNQEAWSWIQNWPNWPHHVVILYGPHAAGKTHLAHVWQQKSRARFITLAQLQGNNLSEKYKRGTCFIIDDVTPIYDEHTLFHLYNFIADNNGQLLLIARSASNRWRIELADLRSRILATPQIPLQEPDDALLRAVLIKLCADHQITITSAVQDFILARIERSFGSLLKVVKRLNNASLAQKRRLTLPFVRQVLQSLEQPVQHQIS